MVCGKHPNLTPKGAPSYIASAGADHSSPAHSATHATLADADLTCFFGTFGTTVGDWVADYSSNR